jgi:V8-like Glu-specific endopeptidase
MFPLKFDPFRARRTGESRSHSRVRATAWLGLLVAAIVLVAAGTFGSAASGKSDNTVAVGKPAVGAVSGDNVSSGPLDAAAAVRYWTPQRMAQARPVPAAEGADGGAPTQSAPTGSPHLGEGWAPAGLREGPTGGPASPTGSDGQPLVECYRCFIPYTRWYYFARYRSYPVSTVAKVFFVQNGSGFVCSGATLYTNLVNTAGHCVHTGGPGGSFSTNVMVCPSYNAGVNPAVGCWGATQLWTKSVWANTSSTHWDEGEIVTSTCGTVNCTSIANITGYLGYLWGASYNQNHTSFGYPQAAPFDGNYIVVCNSQFGYTDSTADPQGGPALSSIGCDMTGGSSGGPWIVAFGSGNYVNGHNDWKFFATPQAMQSPYYDANWCSLINSAGRPCS